MGSKEVSFNLKSQSKHNQDLRNAVNEKLRNQKLAMFQRRASIRDVLDKMEEIEELGLRKGKDANKEEIPKTLDPKQSRFIDSMMFQSQSKSSKDNQVKENRLRNAFKGHFTNNLKKNMSKYRANPARATDLIKQITSP